MKVLAVARDGNIQILDATWEASDAPITPGMARRAIRHLFGYIVRATVTDESGNGYTVYTDKKNSHRKVLPRRRL